MSLIIAAYNLFKLSNHDVELHYGNNKSFYCICNKCDMIFTCVLGAHRMKIMFNEHVWKTNSTMPEEMLCRGLSGE